MGLFSKINRKQQRRGEFYVALDLGTEKIKCIVFDNKEGNCHILGKTEVSHRQGNMRGGMVINIPEVSVDARKALDLVYQQAGETPKKTVISLSGDLVKSLVTTVHYHRARPDAHIDANELKNIIYKAQWKALEQIRTLMAHEQDDGQLELKLINTTVVDARIDGYKVANPLNFQGGIITLSIFNSFASLVHLGAIQAIADALELDLISVTAGPYALTKSLLVDNPEFSAIFIDIGANLTDVVVVNEGGIFGMQNFAFGGNSFSRNLSTSLKISLEQAEKIKTDYSQGLLDKRSGAKVSNVLKGTAKLWVKGVGEALDEFSHLDTLPSKIFIAGGGAGLPEIKAILMSKSWSEHLPFAKKPYPAVIETTDIPNIVLAEGLEINLSDMVVLGLAHLTLDLGSKDNTIGDMLRRIVVNMQN